MEEMLYVFLAVHFFSLLLIITFVAAIASISPFSHRRYKIFWFWFLSLALAFFVIHVNVDIEMKSKERIGICWCCFISKRPGSYTIYRRNERVFKMQNFIPAYMKERT